MSGSGLEFGSDDGAPLVIGAASTTRSEVRRRAAETFEELVRHQVRRALVQSDAPVDVLRALDACDRAGSDLIVAHTTTSPEHLEELLDRFDVQFTIGAQDAFHVPSRTDIEATGRIFTMTSGTTGAPKLAEHSLPSLLGRVRAGSAGAGEGSRWLLTYQPTGFAGLQVMLTALLTRGAVVLARERTPAAFYEAAVGGQVTHVSATPTFWRSLLMVAVPGELRLRQVTLGAEATDQPLLDRLRSAFPDARITHTYASTEAGVIYAVHDGVAGFPSSWLEQNIQGIGLRVRDGFLQVKSERAMRGYATETAQPFLDDGWLATADRCEVRDDRAYIIGREDSTINVAGSKVYPTQVEAFLLTQPGVVEAAVYGVPNPLSGFLVGADVVLAPDRDPESTRAAVLAACREKLPGYQVPRVFKLVDAIAVGVSGKKSGRR